MYISVHMCRPLHSGMPSKGSLSLDHRFPASALSCVTGTGSQMFCNAPGSTGKLLECDFDNASDNVLILTGLMFCTLEEFTKYCISSLILHTDTILPLVMGSGLKIESLFAKKTNRPELNFQAEALVQSK